MQGRLLRNLPLLPLSIISAVTARPTPGVLPLRISRTTTEPPPMVTSGDIRPDDTTVALHVLRSPLRTAGWLLTVTFSEPSARSCGGIGGCFMQVTRSSGFGTAPGAGVATVGRHICEKKPLAISRYLGSSWFS